jgi:hypothetical protein
LVNFATTGDPNGRGLPKWTPYNFETEDYLDFGDTVQLRNHLLKAQLDFIEQFQKRRLNSVITRRNRTVLAAKSNASSSPSSERRTEAIPMPCAI